MSPAEICTAPSPVGSTTFSVLRVWNLPHLIHGFMARDGGVSKGLYRSFNLAEGVGDDASAVSANWARWRAVYPDVRVALLEQIHSNRVHMIGATDKPEPPIGDGMVTRIPGIVLAIYRRLRSCADGRRRSRSCRRSPRGMARDVGGHRF